MTLILSPRAEELLQDVEDAAVMGKEAEQREGHILDGEYGAQEISAEERRELMAVLYHKKRGKELSLSFQS